MTRAARLDVELVKRGLAASRSEAQAAIDGGRVLVKGLRADRAATMVRPEDEIRLAGPARPFVSRGGEKLDGALARLDVAVEDRTWLDAGASTGGFTDRLLRGGARAVIAVDVGYGQLAWSLREDARVHVMERVNVRELTPDDLPFVPDAAVADLSFISLRTVLPVLNDLVAGDGDLLLLVKPQFEVGKDSVGKGGVVRDPGLWRAAVRDVVGVAAELGRALAGCVPSEVPGPAGNREFFVHLRADATTDLAAIDAAVGEVSP